MIEKRGLLVLNLLEVIKIFILVYLLHPANNEIRNPPLPVTKFFARRPWITGRDYSIWSLRAFPPFDIRLGDNRTGVSCLVSRNTAFLKEFYIAKWKNATSIILCRTTLLVLVSDIFIFLFFYRETTLIFLHHAFFLQFIFFTKSKRNKTNMNFRFLTWCEIKFAMSRMLLAIQTRDCTFSTLISYALYLFVEYQ